MYSILFLLKKRSNPKAYYSTLSPNQSKSVLTRSFILPYLVSLLNYVRINVLFLEANENTVWEVNVLAIVGTTVHLHGLHVSFNCAAHERNPPHFFVLRRQARRGYVDTHVADRVERLQLRLARKEQGQARDELLFSTWYIYFVCTARTIS